MSTMYYFYPDMAPIGQTHSLGKDKGYHFTWCIFPLDFCGLVTRKLYKDAIVTEVGTENQMSIDAFVRIIQNATSQSFDERIV